MSDQQPPPPHPRQHEYNDDWLPEDFKPMSFRQLLWQKLRSAPFVGVGLAATVYSFTRASYYYRLGNHHKFNVWLRWRVATQAFTVAALIYYGGVAFTAEKQAEYTQKQRVLLGELPTNTPILKASNTAPFWPWGKGEKQDLEEEAYRAAVLGEADPNRKMRTSDAAAQAEYQAIQDENAKHYPLPAAERMRAAEFAARLRAAERAHEAEEGARSAAASSPTALLAKRMERAYEQRGEGVVDKKIRLMNKNKIRKEAEAEEARAASESEDGSKV